MSDLKQRILKASEFNKALYPRHGCDISLGRFIGAEDESNRLRPLIEALAECPVAIERFIKASTVTFDGQEKTSEWREEWEGARCGLDKALANLERLVGKE